MIVFPEKSFDTKALIFDSHAHFYDEKFNGFRDELLKELPSRGVGAVINCGCDKKSSQESIILSEKYDYMYCAVGIHPGNLDSGTTVEEIEKLSSHKKCVAIGEIGLDYYWEPEKAQEQKEIFKKQLDLAKKLGLPVIVHDRDAHGDTLEILTEYKPRGVLHSFSGSPEMARELIKMGMYIGIGGVVTFKNAKKLPDVVAELPEDRILLETDAPYLTPVPYRSKINNSAMIYLVAEKIAEIRNTTTDHILNIAYNNAKTLFSQSI